MEKNDRSSSTNAVLKSSIVKIIQIDIITTGMRKQYIVWGWNNCNYIIIVTNNFISTTQKYFFIAITFTYTYRENLEQMARY